MKLTLNLSDWCDERHIYVFAGMELAAYKYLGESMRVKVSRCHQCGGCCSELGEVSPGWPDVKDGTCTMLIPDGPEKRICVLGSGRPFACSAGVQLKNVPGCTERFEEVK